jgi:tetratricopeptide (TPR) repeat protein
MKRFFVYGLATVLGLTLAMAPVLGGQEGRVAGTVVDPEGNPIEGVQITVVARNYDFETTRTTNKKGRFNLLVMDATREYGIVLEKEGFATIQEPIDPPLGDTLRHTWTMVPGSGGGAPAATSAMATGDTVAPADTSVQGAAGRKYSQGLEAFQADDLDTARARFEEVVELAPDLLEGHTALALVLVRQEAYEEALVQTNKVLEMSPDDIAALKIQYETYRALGNTAMEDSLLDKLIQISPDPDLAPLAFNSAVAKVQAGDMAGGAARFEQVKEMDPELLPVYSALARVYYDLNRYEDSVAMSNEYLTRDPSSGEVLGVLYLAQDRLGNEAEAQAAFERLKGADSTQVGKIMQEMAVTYFNNGDLEQAQELLEKVLEIQPENPKAHYHLGLCYVSLGDTGKAKEMLNRFVELAPDDPDAAVAKEMIATL